MILGIECAVACLLMFGICFLGTGNDAKNLKNFSVFGDELKDLVRNDEELKDKVKVSNPLLAWLSNLGLFTVILFIFGIFIREKGNYLYGFVGLVILGQVINLFDLLVCDLLYFRNAKRVRILKYSDKKYYSCIKYHFFAFLRAIPMFVIAAAIDAALIMLF